MRIRALLMGLPLVVIIVVLCLAGLPFCASCGDHDDAMTAVLKRCKRATDLLGDDAHPARLGIACGSTEVSGNRGNASWSRAYTGSKNRGDVTYDAIKKGGEWTIESATLTVGDEEIDLVACANGGAKPAGRLAQTNADGAKATFTGKVIQSTHPTIAVGATCTGDLDRARGSPTARVRVRCGAGAEATVAYDRGGSFTLDVRDASRPDDDHIEYDDSEALDHEDARVKCRLSARDGKGTLSVWSTAKPVWEIVVEL
jgi:hypothetical protein